MIFKALKHIMICKKVPVKDYESLKDILKKLHVAKKTYCGKESLITLRKHQEPLPELNIFQ